MTKKKEPTRHTLLNGKNPVCPTALKDGFSVLSLTSGRLAAITRACDGIFSGLDAGEIGKII